MSLLVSRQWIKQNSSFDSTSSDTFSVIDVDSSGNTYLAFQTEGTVNGGTKIGLVDIVVSKFDTNGNVLWTVQNADFNAGPVGTGILNQFPSISTDLSNNVYIAYQTTGTVSGQTKTGATDIVVFKLNGSNGSIVWVAQNGNLNASGGDPTTNNLRPSIAAPKNNSNYVFGAYYTNGTVAGQDPPDVSMNTRIVNFRMNASNGSLSPLNQGWVYQKNSINTNLSNINPSVAIDSLLNMYVAYVGFENVIGSTTNTGFFDIVVYKLQTSGVLVSNPWIKQNSTFNTDASDNEPSITVDQSNNTYVSYTTDGGSISDVGTPIFNSFQNSSIIWQPLGTVMRDLLPSFQVSGTQSLNVIQIGYINTETDPTEPKTPIDLLIEIYTDDGALAPDFENIVFSTTVPITYVDTNTVVIKNVLSSILILPSGLYWLKVGPSDNPKWNISWATGNISGLNVPSNYYYDEIGTMTYYPNNFDGKGCANLLVSTGNTIPSGNSTTPIGTKDIIVFKLGTTGSTEWVQQSALQNTNGVNQLSSIKAANDGYLYLSYDVNGSATFPFFQSTGNPNVAISKMRQSTGSVVWTYVRSLWNSTSQNNYPKIGLDTAYNIYCSYYTNGIAPSISASVGSTDIVVFKLNQNSSPVATDVKYLLYNDQTKEVTYNSCIPQEVLSNPENITIVDPTSELNIGNSRSITNIENCLMYTGGWFSQFRSGGLAFTFLNSITGNTLDSTNNEIYGVGYQSEFAPAPGSVNQYGLYSAPFGLGTITVDIARTMTSGQIGYRPSFLWKFDTSGNAKWVAGLGHTGSNLSEVFVTNQVSALDDSVYYTAETPNSINRVFALNGPNYSTIGLTGATYTASQATHLAKFDSSGQAQWLVRMHIPSSSNSFCSRCTVKAYDDSIYCGGLASSSGETGVVAYSAPIGLNAGLTGSVPSFVNSYGFLFRFDTSGIPTWFSKIEGSNSTSSPQDSLISNVSANDTGVYVVGQLRSNDSSNIILAYNGATGSTIGLTGPSPGAANVSNGFLVKYDKNGQVKWITRQTGGQCQVKGISVNKNSIYIVGIYTISPFTIFDGPKGETIGFSGTGISGSNDIFVAKYNSDGKSEWLARVSGGSDEVIASNKFNIASTDDGCYVNAYLRGNAIGDTYSVYNGPNGTQLGITGTFTNIRDGNFMIKFDPYGKAQWLVRSVENGVKSLGTTVGKGGIYFMSFDTGGDVNYFTRNNGSILKYSGTTYDSTEDKYFMIRLDFSNNIIPTFNLNASNSSICPNTKYITYKTINNNPVNIEPSGNTIVQPSFGNVSGFSGTQTGSNLKLLYNPTTGTDWFINNNTGFSLY